MEVRGPDLGCPASIRDPTGYFAPWRERPVAWSDAHRGWAVMGHREVGEAFRDVEVISADRIPSFERAARDRPAAFTQVVDLLRGWMIFRDPPAHTRLREPVRAAFTPRRLAAFEQVITRITDELVGRLEATAAARDGGPVDLTEELARPLPALVIAALLGIDDADRHGFQGWSDELAAIVFSTAPSSSPVDEVIHAAESFRRFFGPVVDHERHADGLLGAIAEGGGSALERDELIGLCTLLLFAGHETTTSLLIHSLRILLERPELVDRLRHEPGGWEPAVEELLRVRGPARTMARKVAADHQRGGEHLRRGDTIFLSIAAANHDPAVFDDPARLDVARDPNPHLGFGWGLHHCLGANLARAEVRITLRALLERFPDVRPAEPLGPILGALMGFARQAVPVLLT